MKKTKNKNQQKTTKKKKKKKKRKKKKKKKKKQKKHNNKKKKEEEETEGEPLGAPLDPSEATWEALGAQSSPRIFHQFPFLKTIQINLSKGVAQQRPFLGLPPHIKSIKHPPL